MLVIMALAISGLINPGSGGVNVDGFLPSSAPSSSGLYLAVVFSIFLFTGFESAGPLAEETQNPRKLIPRAIWVSLAVVGAFFVFSNWAILIGHGTHDITGFASSANNPVIELAKHLWGWGWLIVLIAMINSILGVSIACTNSASRVFFSMGRSGALPKRLGAVHPKFRTPTNAILFQTFVTLATGLGIGFAMGPDNEFYMMGVTITLGLIMVYIAGNAGVTLNYWRERRSEFNIVLHGLFPVLTSAALIFVAYKSIVPYPAYPGSVAPIIVGVWLVLGVALIIYLSRTGREEWMVKAAEVYGDSAPDERAPDDPVAAPAPHLMAPPEKAI
jgi:amino acid transporter